MTFSRLTLGEPRLRGKVRGGPVGEVTCESQFASMANWSNTLGGFEEVISATGGGPNGDEIPFALAADDSGINIEAFRFQEGVVINNDWAEAPWGGWCVRSGFSTRTLYDSQYAVGNVWVASTASPATGTYHARHLLGWNGTTWGLGTPALTPIAGAFCTLHNGGYPPYSFGAIAGQLVTIGFSGSQSWVVSGHLGQLIHDWRVQVLLHGDSWKRSNSDTSISFSGSTDPSLVGTPGAGYENFEVSFVMPAFFGPPGGGVGQVQIILGTYQQPGVNLPETSGWVDVDNVTITVE